MPMSRYLVQEEYREDVRGVRVVLVEAESKEAVIEDGEYEVLDIVEELDSSADCYSTSLVDDVQFLQSGWTELIKEDK
tara:strand:+ start:8761 stop:8994 length:234 start_codon:yes stop_codon:yes gene_type:complete